MQDDSQAVDTAARLLVVACALNLNGLLWLAFNLGQLASVAILASSLYLLYRRGRMTPSPLAALVLSIALYLLFSGMIFNDQVTESDWVQNIVTYSGSILIIWSVAGYVSHLEDTFRTSFLHLVRNALLVSAASVWASPILYSLFANLPPSASQRMGGFFANPNEAAIASVASVVFLLAMPFGRRILQILALMCAAGAVFLTLSKAGVIALILVLALYAVVSLKGYKIVIAIAGCMFAVLIVSDIQSVIYAVIDQPIFELDAYQRGRLLAVWDILSGQIDERTSTGRTYLWALALDSAWEHFPWGAGLGSAHHIAGGVLENGVWQGAHNTFLMVWVEAGVLPAALFVVSVAALAITAVRRRAGYLEWALLVLFFAEMLATHTALGERYQNLLVGILIGLLSRSAGSQGLQHLVPHPIRTTINKTPVIAGIDAANFEAAREPGSPFDANRPQWRRSQ